jgi:hypothetical protein
MEAEGLETVVLGSLSQVNPLGTSWNLKSKKIET